MKLVVAVITLAEAAIIPYGLKVRAPLPIEVLLPSLPLQSYCVWAPLLCRTQSKSLRPCSRCIERMRSWQYKAVRAVRVRCQYHRRELCSWLIMGGGIFEIANKVRCKKY